MVAKQYELGSTDNANDQEQTQNITLAMKQAFRQEIYYPHYNEQLYIFIVHKTQDADYIPDTEIEDVFY